MVVARMRKSARRLLTSVFIFCRNCFLYLLDTMFHAIKGIERERGILMEIQKRIESYWEKSAGIWNEAEKILYRSTPMFLVEGEKPRT